MRVRRLPESAAFCPFKSLHCFGTPIIQGFDGLWQHTVRSLQDAPVGEDLGSSECKGSFSLAHFCFVLSLGAIIATFSGIIFNGEKMLAHTKNLLLSSSCTISRSLSLSLFVIAILYLLQVLLPSPRCMSWDLILCQEKSHTFQTLFVPGITCHLLDQE